MGKKQSAILGLSLTLLACSGQSGQDTPEPISCYWVGSGDEFDLVSALATASENQVFTLCGGPHPAPLTLKEDANLSVPVQLIGADSGDSTLVADGDYALAVESQLPITIENIQIDASENSGNYGILVVDSANLTLKDIAIDGAQSRGLYLERSQVVASGITIQNSANYGILALDESRLTLSDSQIQNSGHSGLLAQDSQVDLSQLTIQDSLGTAVSEGGGHGISIQRINESLPTLSASLNGVNISGSQGLGGVFYGVDLHIVDLDITESQRGGLWIAESPAPSLSDIHLQNITGYGLTLNNSPDALLSDLNLDGLEAGTALSAGLIVEGSPSAKTKILTLDGARLTGLKTIGLYLKEGQIDLKNLEITGAYRYGILGINAHGEIRTAAIDTVNEEQGSAYGLLFTPDGAGPNHGQSLTLAQNIVSETRVAIRVDGQPVTASDDLLSQNRYGYYLNDNPTISLTGSEVSESAYVGITLTRIPTVHLQDMTVITSGNENENESGVGILSYDSNLVIEDSQLEGHRSTALAAHLSQAWETGNQTPGFTVESRRNRVQYNGQTGYLLDGGAHLKSDGDTFEHNDATCLLAKNIHSLELNQFVARQCGTGLWLDGGALTLTDSELRQHENSGAQLIDASGAIKNSTIAENTTGLTCEDSQVTLCANTFELNAAESVGCGNLLPTCE